MKKHIKKKGQVAVEYVLLLVVVIALATAFRGFIYVGSSPDDPNASGFVQYWRGLIKKIGQDSPH